MATVDLTGQVQPVEHVPVDFVPQAGILLAPRPASHALAARHLERQPFPRDRRVENEQNADEPIAPRQQAARPSDAPLEPALLSSLPSFPGPALFVDDGISERRC